MSLFLFRLERERIEERGERIRRHPIKFRVLRDGWGGGFQEMWGSFDNEKTYVDYVILIGESTSLWVHFIIIRSIILEKISRGPMIFPSSNHHISSYETMDHEIPEVERRYSYASGDFPFMTMISLKSI